MRKDLPPSAEDPLDAIAGIGLKRRRWLAANFAALTIGDVARLDPIDVTERLAAAGDANGAHAAGGWVATARRIVAANEDAIGPAANSGGSEWQPFATFVVEFVIRRASMDNETVTYVHHVEADRTESWRGVAPDRATSWIATRTSDALANETRSPLGQ